MTAEEIEQWLVTRIADALHVSPDDIGVKTPFAELGVSSMSAAELAGDLEDMLDRTLPTTLLWDYPTIERLARHLADPEAAG
jgi:phthiocerol/phenolphthiocerol synthesis type-I polyketide synthase D